METLQHYLVALQPHWHELGVIAFCLTRIWQLRRRNMWQRKHSALTEQRLTERIFYQSNETLRTVSTAFAQGEQPTLDDLLSHAEHDWSLRSSPERSDDDETDPTLLLRPTNKKNPR